LPKHCHTLVPEFFQQIGLEGPRPSLPRPYFAEIAVFLFLDHLPNHHLFVVPHLDDVDTGGELGDVDFGFGFSYGLRDELPLIVELSELVLNGLVRRIDESVYIIKRKLELDN
jgi:hypothetical protein